MVAFTGNFASTTVSFGNDTLTLTGSAENAFVATINAADGTPVWARSWGGTGEPNGFDVSFDNSGAIYATGNWQGTVSAGGATIVVDGTTYTAPQYAQYAYLMKVRSGCMGCQCLIMVF